MANHMNSNELARIVNTIHNAPIPHPQFEKTNPCSPERRWNGLFKVSFKMTQLFRNTLLGIRYINRGFLNTFSILRSDS